MLSAVNARLLPCPSPTLAFTFTFAHISRPAPMLCHVLNQELTEMWRVCSRVQSIGVCLAIWSSPRKRPSLSLCAVCPFKRWCPLVVAGASCARERPCTYQTSCQQPTLHNPVVLSPFPSPLSTQPPLPLAHPHLSTNANSPSNLDQNRLHGEIPLPARDIRQLAQVDLAVPGVDAGRVDAADKRHLGRHVRVLLAAPDLEAVDAVLVDRVWGPKDRAVPVCHADVVAFV